MSEAVPIWMCTAERIATGSRRRVPEDGPDTWHSDDEVTEDIEADKLTGMYTAEMDPKLGPKKLSQVEAARQLAAANALKLQASSCSESDNPDGFDVRYSHSRKTFVKNAAKDLTDSDIGNAIISSRVASQQSSRQGTPVNSDDEENMTEDAKRALGHARKMAARKVPRCTSAPGTAPPRKTGKVGDTGTRSRAVPDPTPPAQESKAVAPPVAPAEQPKGAKAPPPTMGQQVPKHPMTTRKGSRAGGFRPGVGGSGQKDTRVASSHPSQTLDRDLFPPRRFLPTGKFSRFNGTARQQSP
jgi:hypothetical protein